MNRNTGSVKTFQTSFTRTQEGNPINFGYVHHKATNEKQELVVTVRNGVVLSDVELFVQVVLQNLDKTHLPKCNFATKLRLAREYRVVKVNQNVTRYFVTGFFE